MRFAECSHIHSSWRLMLLLILLECMSPRIKQKESNRFDIFGYIIICSLSTDARTGDQTRIDRTEQPAAHTKLQNSLILCVSSLVLCIYQIYGSLSVKERRGQEERANISLKFVVCVLHASNISHFHSVPATK